MVKMTCMIEIAKVVVKMGIQKMVPGILLEIMKTTLKMVPKRWEMLLVFLAYKMTKQMNEIIAHQVSGSMEITRIRSAVTVTNLASLMKTAADKITFIERQVQQISGLTNDLWRKMKQEVYEVKWKQSWVASAQHR